MQRLYLRIAPLSLFALAMLAVLALAAVIIVELEPGVRDRIHRERMADAARRAERGFGVLASGLNPAQIDRRYDPAGSGIIGAWMSQVTSVYGNLQAKQTSVNPNFAAVVVDMLADAGAEPGDRIAVGLSGSFPALNACVLIAAETMGLRPRVISAAAASQWGANRPQWMWPDMEHALRAEGVIETGSLAASIGGAGDAGRGLSAEGLHAIRHAIRRNGLKLLEANSLDEAVKQRMELYEAGPGDYAAYINVGGSSVSVGSRADKQLLAPGLNPVPPDAGELAQDSIVQRFAALGVPILHLSNMRAIADRYRLPWAPSHTPAAAIGAPFHLREYDRMLSAGLFLLCIAGAGLVGVRLRACVPPPQSEPGSGPQNDK